MFIILKDSMVIINFLVKYIIDVIIHLNLWSRIDYDLKMTTCK